MKIVDFGIGGICVIEPDVIEDNRGLFFECFNESQFRKITGNDLSFVQENHSRSTGSVLRGLHYQLGRPQGKLVRVVAGAIFDVAVDIRRHSSTFRKWHATTLSAENRRMVWIPPGFAHGFLAMSKAAECIYKTTEYWDKNSEHCIAWNDPELAIAWPLKTTPILSDRDRSARLLYEATVFE